MTLIVLPRQLIYGCWHLQKLIKSISSADVWRQWYYNDIWYSSVQRSKLTNINMVMASSLLCIHSHITIRNLIDYIVLFTYKVILLHLHENLVTSKIQFSDILVILYIKYDFKIIILSLNNIKEFNKKITNIFLVKNKITFFFFSIVI